MPEYLAPGVYLEELEGTATPIPGVPTSPPCAPLVRPNFFTGKLLDAADFAAEQDYHREKHRRHNRRLHGFGVVSGLGVALESNGDAPHVAIAPGCAIDRRGEEVEICERVCLRAKSSTTPAFVSIRRFDRPRDPVPGPDGPVPSATEEACLVTVGASVPPDAIPLARLVHAPGGWSIDGSFSAPRARRA